MQARSASASARSRDLNAHLDPRTGFSQIVARLTHSCRPQSLLRASQIEVTLDEEPGRGVSLSISHLVKVWVASVKLGETSPPSALEPDEPEPLGRRREQPDTGSAGRPPHHRAEWCPCSVSQGTDETAPRSVICQQCFGAQMSPRESCCASLTSTSRSHLGASPSHARQGYTVSVTPHEILQHIPASSTPFDPIRRPSCGSSTRRCPVSS